MIRTLHLKIKMYFITLHSIVQCHFSSVRVALSTHYGNTVPTSQNIYDDE